MAEQFKVLILGYGEMGHAIEFLLHNKYALDIWTKRPHDDLTPVVLEDAAAEADVVLFCLPVNPHREVGMRIAALLKPECLCVSIAKGLDESGNTAADIFADVFDERQAYGLMYGPMISEEIRANHFAFAQLACNKAADPNALKKIFSTTNLYVETATDIAGISWSVILKNVYALGFGMADELQLGDNMRGFLAVTALQELDNIVRSMGGQAGSPYHLAGLGDLITTATSENSHHHELGRILARSENQGIAGEGIHTLQMVAKYHLFNTAEYPLFCLIQTVVTTPDNVRQQFASYLKRRYD